MLVAVFAVAAMHILDIITGFWNPSKRWVTYRELSEEIIHSTWLYAVHGTPYDTGTNYDAIRYRTHLASCYNTRGLDRPMEANPHIISTNTDVIRESDFQTRRNLYLENRARPMFDWYTNRATHHKHLNRVWKTAILLSELTALILLIRQAAGDPYATFLIVLGALIVVATSWATAKKHSYLADLYENTTNKLEPLLGRLVATEGKEWGILVSLYENTLKESTIAWASFKLGHN